MAAALAVAFSMADPVHQLVTVALVNVPRWVRDPLALAARCVQLLSLSRGRGLAAAHLPHSHARFPQPHRRGPMASARGVFPAGRDPSALSEPRLAR